MVHIIEGAAKKEAIPHYPVVFTYWSRLFILTMEMLAPHSILNLRSMIYLSGIKDTLRSENFWCYHEVGQTPGDGHCLIHAVIMSINP